MRARAFTLVELAITLSIVGVILVAAATLFTAYLGIVKQTRGEMLLSGKARIAADYVIDEIRRSGFVSQAGAMAIIEDDCAGALGYPACNHTDRLTLMEPLQGYRQCTAEAVTGTVVQVNMRTPSPTAINPFPSPECCFATSSFHRQVVFHAGSMAVPALLTSDGSTPGTCTFNYAPLSGVTGTLAGSTIVIADVKTFYVEFDRGTDLPGRLVMHTERDGDTTSVVGERLYLAEGIIDFQLARHAPALPTATTERRLIVDILVGQPNSSRGTATGPAMRLGPARTLASPHLYFEAVSEAALRAGE